MKAPGLLVEPEELSSRLQDNSILIVDLCTDAQYLLAHIPGAVHLPYGKIVNARKPVVGLLPDIESFNNTVQSIGLKKNQHVIAYDDEGGGCAARFIWTLHVYGHIKASILNGGLHSWTYDDHELDNSHVHSQQSDYCLPGIRNYVADSDYIQSRLGNNDFTLLDARSPDEYNGIKKLARKAGHIPGAQHFEWTDAMDPSHNLRLLPAEQLDSKLSEMDFNKNKEVVVYCHSHHRSALLYVMLRSLGYESVKGYPGSWSDWGNREDTPVET